MKEYERITRTEDKRRSNAERRHLRREERVTRERQRERDSDRKYREIVHLQWKHVKQRTDHATIFLRGSCDGTCALRSDFKPNEPRRHNTPPKKKRKSKLVGSLWPLALWLAHCFVLSRSTEPNVLAVWEMWCLSTDTSFRAAEVLRHAL